jgi:hypothetical protein
MLSLHWTVFASVSCVSQLNADGLLNDFTYWQGMSYAYTLYSWPGIMACQVVHCSLMQCTLVDRQSLPVYMDLDYFRLPDQHACDLQQVTNAAARKKAP